MKIAVIGNGGAGTVFALNLANNGNEVVIWAQEADEVKSMQETHMSPWLKDVKLPDSVEYTNDPACVVGKDLVILACPSFALREECAMIEPFLDKEGNTMILSVVKGLEHETMKLMSEIVTEVTGLHPAILSGPVHTIELANGAPTGCVVASTNSKESRSIQAALTNNILRVYTSRDAMGVEIGGTLKNVIAIITGISEGLGYGDNTKTLLMTRGMAEITKFATHFGGDAETLSGLSGIGDLINTCTSERSRNRKLGILLGQGMSVEEAIAQIGSVAEGYYAARAVKEIADRDKLYLPLMSAVYEVLYEDKKPIDAARALMEPRSNSEGGHSSWFLSKK